MALPLALLLCLAAATSCRTIRVNTDYDPNARFADLETWAWFAESPPATGNPRLDSSLLHGRIRSAIEAQLKLQGFEQRDSDPVDFKVAYHVAIDRKIEVDTFNDYYGGYGWGGYWGGGMSTHTSVSEYDEGTLIVDILDPNSRNLIWRGTALSELYEDSTPEKRTAHTQEAVAKLFSKFPPELEESK